jgi:hypothetical protein
MLDLCTRIHLAFSDTIVSNDMLEGLPRKIFAALTNPNRLRKSSRPKIMANPLSLPDYWQTLSLNDFRPSLWYQLYLSKKACVEWHTRPIQRPWLAAG